MEEINTLCAISPIDGRYRNMIKDLENYFSEYAYIRYRVLIEIKWLEYLIENNGLIRMVAKQRLKKLK